MKTTSPEQLKHNTKLWKYYPIGMIQAIWGILNDLREYSSSEEEQAIDRVCKALDELENIIRNGRHPLPKRKI